MEIINYDDLYNDAVVNFSNQYGIKAVSYKPTSFSLRDYLTEQPAQIKQDVKTSTTQTQEQASKSKPQDYSKFSGFEQFNRVYDRVQAYNPDAAKYRSLLTKIASLESSFRPEEVNKIGAAGYFQFIDSTRNGIMKKLGKSTNKQTFLKNPELQILAAIELAKEFENSFNQEELKKASQKGHTINGLISGAWLGGVQGVRRYLNKGKDSSDGGTTISARIKIGDNV